MSRSLVAAVAAAALPAAVWGQAASPSDAVSQCAAGGSPELCGLDGDAGSVSLLQREAAGTGRTIRAAELARARAAPAAGGRCTAADFGAKDLDLVLYGATGFTGHMASEYLAKDHPDKPRWAIAGRHKDELEQLQAELSKLGSNPPEIVVADLSDPASLEAMTARAKVVMTYAGPYRKYGGEGLIQAAVATCTHYADLCGESGFKEDMLLKYGAAAKARGVAIVQAVGMDSLPGDVLAAGSAEMLAADNQGPPTDVTVYITKFNTFFSGGTASSGADGALEENDKGKDPYSLSPEAPAEARVDKVASGEPPHTAGSRGPKSGMAGYDANISDYTFPYIMGMTDGPTVRRTLTLTYPGAPIHLAEVMGKATLMEMKRFMLNPDALEEPLNFHPAPGEGPPSWLLQKGSLAAQGLAARGPPHAARAELFMHCLGDPSYNNTARWSTEISLSLAFDGPLGGNGGYLTPALALGPQRIMTRLSEANGKPICTFWRGGEEEPKVAGF